MKEIEIIAETPDEARDIAAQKHSIDRDYLEVIEEYEPDELDLKNYMEENGLTESPDPDKVSLFVLSLSFDYYVKTAQEWTEGLISRFVPDATAEAIPFRHLVIVRLTVPESSILIGKQGATLDALQHVVVRALLTKDESFPDVMLDVDRYREKKLIRLEKEAKRAADKASRSGRRVPMTPMSPAERKFIHNTLKDMEGIKTESRGKDRARHIVVESTNPKPQGGRDFRRGGGDFNRKGGGDFNKKKGNGGGGFRQGKGGKRGAPVGNKISDDQRQMLYGNMKENYADDQLSAKDKLLPKFFDEELPREPSSAADEFEFEDEIE